MKSYELYSLPYIFLLFGNCSVEFEFRLRGISFLTFLARGVSWRSTVHTVRYCVIFFNSNHSIHFLDFTYFVITQILKKDWVKLVHRVPNGGVLKIAPPNFSFINWTDSCKFKDFLKTWNAHNFFIFKARLLIFWVIGHANDLVTWYD